MTGIPLEGKSGSPGKSRGFLDYEGRKLPTRKREEPSIKDSEESCSYFYCNRSHGRVY